MKSYALVLAGGGGKGAYQIGVWSALRKLGFDKYFQCVIGTSVGALNAALFAQGDLECAQRLWRTISAEKVLGEISFSEKRNRPDNPLFRQDALRSLITSNINFSRLSISAYACCARKHTISQSFTLDFNSNRQLDNIFSNKAEPEYKLFEEYYCINHMAPTTATDVLLASAALPIVFGQTSVGDQQYLDGGLLQNTPYQKAIALGYSHVFVVHLEQGIDRTDIVGTATVYHVYPSQSLGELIDGTLDFDGEHAVKRMALGESDILQAQSKLASFFENKSWSPDSDYRRRLRSITH